MVGRLVLLCLLLLTVAASAAAQPAPAPSERPSGLAPVLFILDASGSMAGDDGTGRTKIDAARDALRQLIGELPDGAPIGLRVYGHRVPDSDRANGCRDTELVVPVGPLERGRMIAAIDALAPTGFTPIGESLRAALGDLPQDGPRTVVLVSDGIDTCAPPDPCDQARQLAADSVDLRIETIGFQTDAAAAGQLRCIAEVTGGQFRSADNAPELLRALREYEVAGAALAGAPGLAEAVEGAELAPGQYRDSLQVGEQRWYVVELEEGQTLRTAATIVGTREGGVSPSASFALEVRGDDVLGELSCGTDTVERIGQEARQVGIDGLRVQEQGLCQEPGRYAVGVRLEDPVEPSPIEGRDFDVELLVDVVDGQQGAATESFTARPAARAAESTAEVPAAGTGVRGFLLAGLGAAVVGALIGAFAAWRLGP